MLIYPGVQRLFSSFSQGTYQRNKNKRAPCLFSKFALQSVAEQKPGIFDELKQFTWQEKQA